MFNLEEYKEEIEEVFFDAFGKYIENDIKQVYNILRKDFVYIKDNVEYIEEDLKLLDIISCEILSSGDEDDINLKIVGNNIKANFNAFDIVQVFDNDKKHILRITYEANVVAILKDYKKYDFYNFKDYNKIKILNVKYSNIEYDDLRCI